MSTTGSSVIESQGVADVRVFSSNDFFQVFFFFKEEKSISTESCWKKRTLQIIESRNIEVFFISSYIILLYVEQVCKSYLMRMRCFFSLG